MSTDWPELNEADRARCEEIAIARSELNCRVVKKFDPRLLAPGDNAGALLYRFSKQWVASLPTLPERLRFFDLINGHDIMSVYICAAMESVCPVAYTAVSSDRYFSQVTHSLLTAICPQTKAKIFPGCIDCSASVVSRHLGPVTPVYFARLAGGYRRVITELIFRDYLTAVAPGGVIAVDAFGVSEQLRAKFRRQERVADSFRLVNHEIFVVN